MRQKVPMSKFNFFCWYYCCASQGERKAYSRAKESIEDETDILTYYRKMKKIDLTLKTLFTEKERYLLTKQDCFVLDTKLDKLPKEVEEIDSDLEDGPKKSTAWWEGIQSWNTMLLMDGLTGDIKTRRRKASKHRRSNVTDRPAR